MTDMLETRPSRSWLLRLIPLPLLLAMLPAGCVKKEHGEQIHSFQGHAGPVSCVAFSPDSQFALSCGTDKTIRMWDVKPGKEIRRFDGHADLVSSVAFSPDGRRILSGSYDWTVRLWDTTNGKELRAFKGPNTQLEGVDLTNLGQFRGHQGSVDCVAFSLDGQRALSGGNDGTMRL